MRRYTSGKYASLNPDWDSIDSPWKAQQVLAVLDDHRIFPTSIVEIGCGAGGILACLRKRYPTATMTGYDIAPELSELWKKQAAADIRYVLGDYFAEEALVPDVILVLDVIEHLGNPFEFLSRLSKRANRVVFHIPLDLSSLSVLREAPLLHVRYKVGHLHFFTKSLAIETLKECGFEIIDARYTDASFSAPRRAWKTKIASIARRIIYKVMGEAGVRLIGGQTLIVLARPKATSS